MTDDIVTRLREIAQPGHWQSVGKWDKTANDAADEIERLRVEKAELLEAIRLTAEYYLPPALDNWEWWKAYSKYADPQDARRMKSCCDEAMAQEVRGEQ